MTRHPMLIGISSRSHVRWMKIPVQVGVIAHGNPTQMVLFMHEMIRRKEFGHVGTLCRPEIAKKK
jgi:hypothetical protein